MKKWIISIIFCICSILLTVFLYMLTKSNSNSVPLDTLSFELTKGYQVRQIITSIIIYIIGFILTAGICVNFKTYWYYFLAYPIGIAIWCIISLVLIVIGIPYKLEFILLSLIPLLLVSLIKIFKQKDRISISDFMISIFYFIGISSIVSSGLLTIFLSSDSAYFIIQYGQLLAKAGKITDAVNLYLTWTGIMPAFISSLATFGGFVTIFTLHYLLIISFLGIFGIFVYETISNRMHKKKAIFITALCVCCLILVPAFHLLAQYVIANTYFMVYMFLFSIIAYKMVQEQTHNNDYLVFLVIITIVLTMCRAEALTTVCFLIVCVSTLNISRSKLLFSMLIPAGIVQTMYYVKVFLFEGSSESELVNIKNIIIIMAVWLLTLVYIVIIRNFLIKKLRNKLSSIMLIALLMGNIVLIFSNLDRAYINLDAEFYNVGNEFWGYFPWIALMLCLILIRFASKISFFDLLWIGYILFNFAICMGRFNDLRKGFGDSFNRILIGIIPIFIFSVILHMKECCYEKIEGITKDETNYTDTML